MPTITVESTKQEVLAAVAKNGWALEYASETLKNNRDVVLAAVAQEGWALEYASETLKDDREVVLAAVAQKGLALQYASEKLKDDRDFVLDAVAQKGWALQYASERLKNDREVVLAAVAQKGLALQYASEKLKDDRDFVLDAVAQKGWALEYASERLKNDRDVVLAAVARDGWALEYASETLKNDELLQKVQTLQRVNPAAFLALNPLKNKLKQETNSERIKAAEIMIRAMENAIVNFYESDDAGKFKQDVAQAISTALPVLEKQTGWKKVIDAVFNAVMNFISPKIAEQSQGKPTYRSFFFANPNPAAKEIEDVEQNISKNL